MRCPKCDKWPIKEEDAYCSNCKERLLALEVSPKRLLAYETDEWDRELRLHVKNVGGNPVIIRGILGVPDGISLKVGNEHWTPQDIAHLGRSLGPGETMTVSLEVPAGFPLGSGVETTLSVEWRSEPIMVPLALLPEPTLDLRDGGFLGIVGQQLEFPASLTVDRGWVVLEELVGFPAWIQPRGTDDLPVAVSPAEPFPFSLCVANPEGAGAGEPHLRARLEVLGERTIPLLRGIVVDSVLSVSPSRVETKAFSGRSRRLRFELRKPAGVALQVTPRFETVVGGPAVVSEAGWSPRAPVALGPDQTEHALEVSLSAPADAQGKAEFRLDMEWMMAAPANLAGETQATIVADVGPIPEFDYPVGADFGTTFSTMCVLADLEHGPEMAPLGDDRRKVTMASAWRYDAFLSAGHEVGDTVRDQMFQRAATTVLSVKRVLGTKNACQVEIGGVVREVSPCEIARDIIREMIRRVEERYERTPGDIVVSVPTSFLLPQQRQLFECYETAGIPSDRIAPIDESLAASLPFLVRRAEMRRSEIAPSTPLSEWILVWDFGGGTTDVTLLKVTYRLEGEVILVAPEVWGCGGDRLLGGDDVTHMLVERVLQRVKDEKGVSIPIARPYERGGRPDDEALYNYQYLWRVMERMKLVLNQALRVTAPAEADFDVGLPRYITGGDPVIVRIVPNDLHDVVRRRLEVAADKVVTLVQLCKPSGEDDVRSILLAGQSSQIVTLREVLSSRFAHAIIYEPQERLWSAGDGNRPGELRDPRPVHKECVALGALRYGLGERIIHDIRLDLSALHRRTMSRIGIGVVTAEGLRFRQVIPFAAELPARGRISRQDVGLGTYVEVLENTGPSDEIHGNPDCYRVARIDPGSYAGSPGNEGDDWDPRTDGCVDTEGLGEDTLLWMTLDQNKVLTVEVNVDGEWRRVRIEMQPV